jgi:hypothetical protein
MSLHSNVIRPLGGLASEKLDGKDCFPPLCAGIGNYVQCCAGDELQGLLEGGQTRVDHRTPPDAVEDANSHILGNTDTSTLKFEEGALQTIFGGSHRAELGQAPRIPAQARLTGMLVSLDDAVEQPNTCLREESRGRFLWGSELGDDAS